MTLEAADDKRPVGRPRSAPEAVTQQLAIRLTAQDRETLRQLAGDAGISLSAYVQNVLKAHMRRKVKRG